MQKIVSSFSFLLLLVVLLLVFSRSGAAQNEFYSAENLRYDYKQVAVVVRVDVVQRKLIDFIGRGDCERDLGAGYCLYRLTVNVKEVFKGKPSQKTVEFYASPDADYPKKYLMGEKIVFLNWNGGDSGNKKRLFTLENSTRPVKSEIIERLRKIAKSK